MYKISGIVCPYCGFRDVRKIIVHSPTFSHQIDSHIRQETFEYWCCQCETQFTLDWINGEMRYVKTGSAK